MVKYLVVFCIGGQITDEYVGMLRDVRTGSGPGHRRKRARPSSLKNVLLVDREAVKLLALSEAHGTELRNCPPYIREWVTRERAETQGRPSEQGLERREDIEDV